MKPPSKLAMKQIERRLSSFRSIAKYTHIRIGWIHYMREAMCMTQAILAKAVGSNQATVQQIEKREPAGKVTIETMRKMAAAMNCDFIYAFVPKKELPTFLRDKAITKARKIIREADIHMTLEDQKVLEDIDDRIERVADDLLSMGDIW